MKIISLIISSFFIVTVAHAETYMIHPTNELGVRDYSKSSYVVESTGDGTATIRTTLPGLDTANPFVPGYVIERE